MPQRVTIDETPTQKSSDPEFIKEYRVVVPQGIAWRYKPSLHDRVSDHPGARYLQIVKVVKQEGNWIKVLNALWVPNAVDPKRAAVHKHYWLPLQSPDSVVLLEKVMNVGMDVTLCGEEALFQSEMTRAQLRMPTKWKNHLNQLGKVVGLELRGATQICQVQLNNGVKSFYPTGVLTEFRPEAIHLCKKFLKESQVQGLGVLQMREYAYDQGISPQEFAIAQQQAKIELLTAAKNIGPDTALPSATGTKGPTRAGTPRDDKKYGHPIPSNERNHGPATAPPPDTRKASVEVRGGPGQPGSSGWLENHFESSPGFHRAHTLPPPRSLALTNASSPPQRELRLPIRTSKIREVPNFHSFHNTNPNFQNTNPFSPRNPSGLQMNNATQEGAAKPGTNPFDSPPNHHEHDRISNSYSPQPTQVTQPSQRFRNGKHGGSNSFDRQPQNGTNNPFGAKHQLSVPQRVSPQMRPAPSRSFGSSHDTHPSGREVQEWDVEEAVAWLGKIRMGGFYAEAFRKMRVDGRTLLTATKRALEQDLGVKAIHAGKIMWEIEELKGVSHSLWGSAKGPSRPESPALSTSDRTSSTDGRRCEQPQVRVGERHTTHTTVSSVGSPRSDKNSPSRSLGRDRPLRPETFGGQMQSNNARRTIIMIGDQGVGKTSLIKRMLEGRRWLYAEPTLNPIEIHQHRVNIHGVEVPVQLLDTAGEERFHSMTRNYYRQADGAVLVCDCTDSKTFRNLNRWIHELKTYGKERVVFSIAANKADRTDEWQIGKKDVETLVRNCGGAFFKFTSAETGESVKGLFEETIRQIVRNNMDTPMDPSVIRIEPGDVGKPKKSGDCCG